MGDIEFKVNLKADKNSKEFDEMILQSLIGKSFAIENFEEELKKVFKKKVVVNYGGITSQSIYGMERNITRLITDAALHHVKPDTFLVWY